MLTQIIKPFFAQRMRTNDICMLLKIADGQFGTIFVSFKHYLISLSFLRSVSTGLIHMHSNIQMSMRHNNTFCKQERCRSALFRVASNWKGCHNLRIHDTHIWIPMCLPFTPSFGKRWTWLSVHVTYLYIRLRHRADVHRLRISCWRRFTTDVELGTFGEPAYTYYNSIVRCYIIARPVVSVLWLLAAYDRLNPLGSVMIDVDIGWLRQAQFHQSIFMEGAEQADR